MAPDNPTAAPRLFVSHATEDKAFVRPLAVRLRGDGVEAWVDEWEILGGESLTEKIFEEGIRNCDVFAIVLSATSVAKPWVREELNAAFAMRIERSTRLIAIRIDGCEVPVVLKSRLWINMDPAATDNDEAYRKLLNAIYQHPEKPALGPSPFVSGATPAFGHTPDETAILDLLVRRALAADPRDYLGLGFLVAETGIPLDHVRECVSMLESERHLEVQWMMGGDCMAKLTPLGWRERARAVAAVDPDYDVRLIVALVTSNGPADGGQLLTGTGLSKNRLRLAVDLAEARGLVDVVHVHSFENLGILRVAATARGRRLVR